MNTTSISLLNRVRESTDQEAWDRFVDLYTPMIYRWALGIGLPKSEASDLVQDIFLTLSQKLPSFQYDESKNFRSWLKTVTSNRAKDFLRRRACQAVEGGSLATKVLSPDNVEFLADQEYNQHLTARIAEFMKSEFEEKTWQACWRTLVQGESVEEVSQSLEMTPNAVYVARSKVLRRLRVELDGLLAND